MYNDDMMINMWLFNDSIGSVCVSVQCREYAVHMHNHKEFIILLGMYGDFYRD